MNSRAFNAMVYIWAVVSLATVGGIGIALYWLLTILERFVS